MRKNNSQLYKEWIIKAQNDLKTAEILFKEKGPTDTFCFHCHQAVEKYLKAYLVFYRLPFKKIHDLWDLAKLCSQKDKKILSFEKELKILNAYYIESRYPSEVTVYSQKRCKQVLDISQEIIKFITRSLI